MDVSEFVISEHRINLLTFSWKDFQHPVIGYNEAISQLLTLLQIEAIIIKILLPLHYCYIILIYYLIYFVIIYLS